MSQPPHIIKRQVLELYAGNRADALPLQGELSRIYRQRIVPLIDQACTDLSAPDLIHRIDTLELDLGEVDPHHLERDMVANVRAQLRLRLADCISARERQPEQAADSVKTTSQLELFILFTRTGTVPWWADATQPHLVPDCVQHLMQQAPSLLRRVMRELAAD